MDFSTGLIQREPAGDAVFVFSCEARAGDLLYIVSDYLGVTPADDFSNVEIDCGKGIGGEIRLFGVGDEECAVVGRIFLGKILDFVIIYKALIHSRSIQIPQEFLRIFNDFDVIALFMFHPTIIRQIALAVRRNGNHFFRGILVLAFEGVVVAVPAAVAVHSETTAPVDENGIGGLVLDFHEVHAVLLVVIDGIVDPFLQEVYFDVVVRHQRIGLDAEDGGKVFRFSAVTQECLCRSEAVMTAVVPPDNLLVVFVRSHVNHFLRYQSRGTKQAA